jgi:hypothetical protein
MKLIFHGTTSISKQIVDSYSSSITVRIFLTATYSKPLREWNIDNSCLLYWDIEDEKLCKNRDIDGLVLRHGNTVTELIQNDTLSIYDTMPGITF